MFDRNRHVGRRRAPGRVRRLPDLAAGSPLRTGAKGLAGLGVVAGFGAAMAVQTPASSAPVGAALALPTGGGDAALLGRDASTGTVSRGDARVATTDRVSSPEVSAAPLKTASYGVAAVTAVAKPKPKPQPEAQAAEAGTTASGVRASNTKVGSSAKSSRSYSTSGYSKPGLGANAMVVYNAVRSAFGITNIGGYRSGPGAMDHGTGHAVDVMITSQAQGDAVAAFILANYSSLNVKYVIWRQRIWTTYNQNWRMMADRGSITANHYDHVHISVN